MRAAAVVAGLFCVLVAASAGLSAPAGPDGNDGTVAVKGATGMIVISARGAVIGQLARGKVTLEDPNPNDGKKPVVYGAERVRDLSDTKSLYSGTDIRFRIIGGQFGVRVVGSGIDLSAVGRGLVTLGPTSGLLTAGTVSFDGEREEEFPNVLTKRLLGSG